MRQTCHIRQWFYFQVFFFHKNQLGISGKTTYCPVWAGQKWVFYCPQNCLLHTLHASLQERPVKLISAKKSSNFFPSENKEAGTIHKWGSRVSSTAREPDRFFSSSRKFLLKFKKHKIKSYKNSSQSTMKCVQISSHFCHKCHTACVTFTCTVRRNL